MSRYAKAIAAAIVSVLIAGLVAAEPLMSDGALTVSEWVTISIAALTPLAVYLVPNAPAADK